MYVGLLVLFCSLIILFLYIDNRMNKFVNYINELRLDSNQLYEEISNRWPLDNEDISIIENTAKSGDVNLTIIELNETIIYSDSHTLDLSNERILLNAFYMDKSYTDKNSDSVKISQPIYSNEQAVAFAIFEKIYADDNGLTNLFKQIVIGLLVAVMVASLFISGYLLFRKKNPELEAIEKGLMDISKGVLRPISVSNSNDYKQLYNTYNTLVEELTYIMKQQQSYEGQRKEFLTMISHELKTPISTISAYIEGLTSGVATDDETKEKYLKIISDKIQQLTKQVEDFFKYAQDEVNRFKYNFEECYADDIIGEIFSRLMSNQHQNTSIQNLLPRCIFSIDKTRIEQVIMNLYNNACKHTSMDESIILKAYREDDDVVIEIEDNGEGISPKDLPYIFDYYYQGETSKKRDYEGIGLGLAICKNIITSHKGSMKVKSKVDIGTTMYIKLPLV